MLSLQLHHITDLYVIIDDMVPNKPTTLAGRHTLLSDSELVTILIWNALSMKQKTLKGVWSYTKLHLSNEFKRLPNYSAFVDHCHRVLEVLVQTLESILSDKAPVRFMDSTMLEVCKLPRANNHKVARDVASFGKNHQGWHYGFKLHASIDINGTLCGLTITSANIHDTRAMPKILNQYTKVAVGDGGYNAKAMRDHIFKEYGTLIVAPPHPKQNKKLMTKWQHALLNMRSKIESVYDYLKEHMSLVSSFPRSKKGYLLHYIRILLGYQVEKVMF